MKRKVLMFFLCCTVVSVQAKTWTLKECIDYALANNITLKKTQLTRMSAREDYLQSQAALLPSLSDVMLPLSRPVRLYPLFDSGWSYTLRVISFFAFASILSAIALRAFTTASFFIASTSAELSVSSMKSAISICLSF